MSSQPTLTASMAAFRFCIAAFVCSSRSSPPTRAKSRSRATCPAKQTISRPRATLTWLKPGDGCSSGGLTSSRWCDMAPPVGRSAEVVGGRAELLVPPVGGGGGGGRRAGKAAAGGASPEETVELRQTGAGARVRASLLEDAEKELEQTLVLGPKPPRAEVLRVVAPVAVGADPDLEERRLVLLDRPVRGGRGGADAGARPDERGAAGGADPPPLAPAGR